MEAGSWHPGAGRRLGRVVGLELPCASSPGGREGLGPQRGRGALGGWLACVLKRGHLLQMSGKWYLKAVITDRETSWKKPELVTPMTLTVLEGGNLKAETTLL